MIRQYTSDVYVYGMVKDSHHRTRALIGEQGEIEIKATRSVFKLISDIQNEVHRFALGYHHTKSTNRNFSLQLNQIDGVGKKRAQELLKHFKNLNEVAAADVDKLMEVKGITIKIAQNIYNFYHNF